MYLFPRMKSQRTHNPLNTSFNELCSVNNPAKKNFQIIEFRIRRNFVAHVLNITFEQQYDKSAKSTQKFHFMQVKNILE